MINTEELTIEIIDDSEADRFLMKSYLDERIGKGQYFYLEADEATKGLEVFSKGKPDCVILDYNLPDDDGYHVLQKIKKLDKTVPVIVVTNEGNEAIATNMMYNGASYYLPKNSLNADILFKVIFDSFSKMSKDRKADFSNNELLGLMTHEIKTPLNTISLVSDLLGQCEVDKEVQSYIEVLNESASILVKISENILNLQKVESDTFQVNFMPGNLKRTVSRVVDYMNYSIQSPKVKIIADIDENIPDSVMADFLFIKQVLINLIKNSIKFTYKGFIRVKLSLVEEESSRLLVRIEVEDSGIGIPKEKLNVIFEKYHQECSDKMKKQGTGLGLALCKTLVEIMGGEISVESELGSGSNFTVDLPLIVFDEIFKNSNLN
ncbi:MAG: ATP-binding protein [Lentisphaeraceae bacterium]|nr:ATP-binding protein [Lentisphaeraceae bacterium]